MVPANVLLYGMLSAPILSLKDLCIIRSINKEFKDAIEFSIGKYIDKALYVNHCSLEPIGDSLLKSLINIPELERFLDSLNCAHLSKCTLIRRDQNVNDINVSATIDVLNKLYVYVYEQQCNTIRQVGLLYLNFLHNLHLHLDWYKAFDMYRFDKAFLKINSMFKGNIFICCQMAQIHIPEFYIIFALISTYNVDTFDEYLATHEWWKNSNDNSHICIAYITLWIQILNMIDDIIFGNEDIKLQMKARIIFMIMSYIKDLYSKAINPICKDENFQLTFVSKASEFIADADKIKPLNFQTEFTSLISEFTSLITEFTF
jgi:hypothetical protein